MKRSREGLGLFDLDANNSGVTADVKVLVLDVSQTVGEVNHGAVGKSDVELLIVEGDVKLVRLNKKKKKKKRELDKQ